MLIVAFFNIRSPSSRGRGLKYAHLLINDCELHVALFTRAWIEIVIVKPCYICYKVALFTRAWIEISIVCNHKTHIFVALFTRAWIEMDKGSNALKPVRCRPLHEGVD